MTRLEIMLKEHSQNYTLLYRKEFKELLGSTNAAILLGQLIYWHFKAGGEFYKFKEPNEKHPSYKKGDSWCEELGFTTSELKTATQKIKQAGLLTTRQDCSNLLWWSLNVDKLEEFYTNLEFNFEPTSELKKDNRVEKNSKVVGENSPRGNQKDANAIHNAENTQRIHKDYSVFSADENSQFANSENSQNVKSESEKAVDNYLYGNRWDNRWLLERDKPPFISDEVWADYCAFKRERGQKVVRTELKAFLAQLEKAHNLGVDVNARIIECISKGYASPVLEPRANETNAKSKAEGVKKSRQVLREWAAKKMAAENEIIDGEVIDDNARIQCGF